MNNSSNDRPKVSSSAQPRFTLVDADEDDEHQALNSPEMPRYVFNLDMQNEGSDGDEDHLLDYQQYTGLQRHFCCGINYGWVSNVCPWIAQNFPPSWWYRYSKKQQRIILTAGGCLLTFLLLVIIFAAAGATKGSLSGWGTTRKGQQYCAWSDWRLPSGVKPSNYHLSLHVEMEQPYSVQGSITIDIDIAAPTQCIVLHSSQETSITDVRLGGAEGITGRVKGFNETLEQVTVEFDSPVPAGKAVVFIGFEYTLREGLSGFYRSTYTLDDGKEYSLATTQFEANSARKAFPCFDEPALKATFEIGIATNADMTVLSNMPIEALHHHEQNGAGVQSWHFQKTPLMSTYLVAFIIGNLKSVERTVPSTNTSEPARKVSIWATPDRIQNLKFAADVASAILPAYEKAFGVPYALPKLDLVAIPDFAAGAMENWGLVTYRQTALLTSPTSGVLDYRYVTLVVAHELAHQWFGNLVTCDYWGELWLNEGFASYMEYLGANAAHPEMNFFSFFWVDNGPTALYFDSKMASHALSTTQGIDSTDKIEGIFDPVSYETGGSLLRMLRSWINRKNVALPTPLWETTASPSPANDTFLFALQQYLEEHKFGTATAEHLWESMSDSLGQDIAPLMDTWTYKQGYPLITVTIDAQRRVWLSQSPFSLQGPQQCDPNTPWWIPVAYVTSAATAQIQWGELRSCQGQRQLLTLPEGGWLKLNAGQYGYYRVNYSPELWQELVIAALTQRSEAAERPLIPALDLAGLLEDSYALSEVGALNVTIFLDLVRSLSLRTPEEYSPWAAAIPYIQTITRLVPCADTWKRYLGHVLFPEYLHQIHNSATTDASGGSTTAPLPLAFSFNSSADGTVAGDPTTTTQTTAYRMLRPLILSTAGYYGDGQLMKEVNELMKPSIDAAAGPTGQSGGAPAESIPRPEIDADVLSAAYQSFAHSSNAPQQVQSRVTSQVAYHTLMRLYVGAKDADEKERTLRALGYSASAIPAALEFSVSEQVRSQDVRTLIVTTAARAGGPDTVSKTWSWFRDNWNRIHNKLGGDSEADRRMAQIMEGIASLSADLGMIDELSALSEVHKEHLDDPSYAARAKESIVANAAWIQRHGDTVCNWVQQYLP